MPQFGKSNLDKAGNELEELEKRLRENGHFGQANRIHQIIKDIDSEYSSLPKRFEPSGVKSMERMK